MRGKIICPYCGEFGRLEIQREDKYRVNHDRIEKGKKTTNRCYLGSLTKAIKNIISVSRVRSDIVDPGLLSEIASVMDKERKEHLEKIHDSDYGTLIARIIQLSRNFGTWKSKTHYLTKQGKCPHCHKRIQYKFTRIGPHRSPKKDIGSFYIEKGVEEKTSWMSEN